MNVCLLYNSTQGAEGAGQLLRDAGRPRPQRAARARQREDAAQNAGVDDGRRRAHPRARPPRAHQVLGVHAAERSAQAADQRGRPGGDRLSGGARRLLAGGTGLADRYGI